jgi:hypothetical protein
MSAEANVTEGESSKHEEQKQTDESLDVDKTLAEQVSQNETEMYHRTQKYMQVIIHYVDSSFAYLIYA